MRKGKAKKRQANYVEFQPESANGPGANDRKLGQAMRRGFIGRCPNCGKGHLFSRLLTIIDQCPNCAEPLHHHRADDLPAYLNIFIVGHIVLGVVVILMRYDLLSMWAMIAVSLAAVILAAIVLMRPLKGMVVGSQWALRMHGFGDNDEDEIGKY